MSIEKWAAQCDDLHCLGFESIPQASWFVLVTMTSVGYGDYYPQTSFGQFFAMWIMLAGIMTIAIPITLIGNKFNECWVEARVAENMAKVRKASRSKMQEVSTVNAFAINEREVTATETTHAHFRMCTKLLKQGLEETKDERFQVALDALSDIAAENNQNKPRALPSLTFRSVEEGDDT